MRTRAVLAFDTSNYTTSVAIADPDREIIADERRMLDVKSGERGLRQSQALFQHIVNLPELTDAACKKAEKRGFEICAVAVSSKPRPEKGSYMPVFRAGMTCGSTIASALNVPIFFYSHQEGHIAAICGIRNKSEEALSFHLSGGTGEIVVIKGNMPQKIVGGIRDLSFGQLIDRTGVSMGMPFPAGAELDKIAFSEKPSIAVHLSKTHNTIIENQKLKPIHTEGAYANLSGIETQIQRVLQELSPQTGKSYGRESLQHALVCELFYRICDALEKIVRSACEENKIKEVIFAGGVSASEFIREELAKRFENDEISIKFGSAGLSSDNAIGIGILGCNSFEELIKK